MDTSSINVNTGYSTDICVNMDGDNRIMSEREEDILMLWIIVVTILLILSTSIMMGIAYLQATGQEYRIQINND